MSREIALSLVIPVYNEEKRIEEGLKKALRYLPRVSYTTEIVLVDDGSTDETLILANQLLNGFKNFQIIKQGQNLGKGAAIRRGVLNANGKYIVFSDIDFSTPITELPKLLDALKISDVAIGVRRHPNSNVTKHQPRVREFLGHIFTLMTNKLATPGIYDVTCGFKGYKKEAAKLLFSKARIAAWAFDAEILFLARKYKLKITQIPVTWADTKGTKVHMLGDGVRAFGDLVKIRMNDKLGYYNK